jgi:hypothetical protein
MKKLVILLSFLILGFSSCKKKDVTPAVTSPTVDQEARDYLYDTMNQ